MTGMIIQQITSGALGNMVMGLYSHYGYGYGYGYGYLSYLVFMLPALLLGGFIL